MPEGLWAILRNGEIAALSVDETEATYIRNELDDYSPMEVIWMPKDAIWAAMGW